MDKYESEKVMKDFQKLHDKIKRLEKTNKALRTEDVMEITHKQHLLLEELREVGGKIGLDTGEEMPYWDLDPEYVRVLVSMGVYEWIVKLTDAGYEYLEENS